MKDFWREASGFYLTINISKEEFDALEELPLAQDFENWGTEYIKDNIDLLADTMKNIYLDALGDACNILTYDDLDEHEKLEQIRELAI